MEDQKCIEASVAAFTCQDRDKSKKRIGVDSVEDRRAYLQYFGAPVW